METSKPKKQTKKMKIVIIISLVLILLLIIGLSYAWLKQTIIGTKEVTITVGDIDLALDESASEGIILRYAIPTEDSDGLLQTPYTFSVQNNSNRPVSYTITLETDEEALAGCTTEELVSCELLDLSDIRYGVSRDGEVIKVGNLYEDPTLDTSMLRAIDGKKDYELRIWLDINTENDAQGKVYYGKIKIVAKQVSNDETAPDCSDVGYEVNVSSETWVNQDAIIKFTNFPSDMNSWEIFTKDVISTTAEYVSALTGATSIATLTLSTDGKWQPKIVVYDAFNNYCEKEISPYWLDKTSPTTPSITNSSGGSQVNDASVTLTITSSDDISGIKNWDYSFDNNTWTTYSTDDTTSTTLIFNEEMNETVYIRVCNKAGLCSESSSTTVNIKYSLPAPSVSNPSGGNWTKDNIVLSVSTTYAGTVSYWQYSYDNSSFTTYANSASSSFSTTPYSVERNQLTYIRYCNDSGDCSPSTSTWIRIDKTAPTYTYNIYHNMSCYTFEDGNISNAQALCGANNIYTAWPTIVSIIYKDSGSDVYTRTISWNVSSGTNTADGNIYTGTGKSGDSLMADISSGWVNGTVSDRVGNSRSVSISY